MSDEGPHAMSVGVARESTRQGSVAGGADRVPRPHRSLLVRRSGWWRGDRVVAAIEDTRRSQRDRSNDRVPGLRSEGTIHGFDEGRSRRRVLPTAISPVTPAGTPRPHRDTRGGTRGRPRLQHRQRRPAVSERRDGRVDHDGGMGGHRLRIDLRRAAGRRGPGERPVRPAPLAGRRSCRFRGRVGRRRCRGGRPAARRSPCDTGPGRRDGRARRPFRSSRRASPKVRPASASSATTA
jgi:hypothetical protein